MCVCSCVSVCVCVDTCVFEVIVIPKRSFLRAMTCAPSVSHKLITGWFDVCLQFNFHGVSISCNNVDADMAANNLTLVGFVSEKSFDIFRGPLEDILPVRATVASLQAMYDALQVWRRENAALIYEREYATESDKMHAPPSFVTQPHLWNREGKAVDGTTRFRYYGYCHSQDDSAVGTEISFNCEPRRHLSKCNPDEGGDPMATGCAPMGTHVLSIDFASYGTASGSCGGLSHGKCALDITNDFKFCSGQTQCVEAVKSSQKEIWDWRWKYEILKQFPDCEADGRVPILEFQVRCGGSPYLSFMGDLGFGVSYDFVQDIETLNANSDVRGSGIGLEEEVRFKAGLILLTEEEVVRCAIASAQPAMMQAHMCKTQESNEADTYVFRGFPSDLELLMEDQATSGFKTVLRLESLPESNHTISDTEITMPATNGILLTSGNLRDITVESGPMTSIAVRKPSFLKGGVTFGPLVRQERFSEELLQNVHDSWWAHDPIVTGPATARHPDTRRSPAEGGAKWNWNISEGPWLTLFGPGDCRDPQGECIDDNVDRAIKFNVSNGGLTRVDFDVMEGVVSQISFPVTWGLRPGALTAHSYSTVTQGAYTQHLCNPDEVLDFDPTIPSGLHWEDLGPTRPSEGTEWSNSGYQTLVAALQRQTQFSPAEWASMTEERPALKTMRTTHYIRAGSSFFRPVPESRCVSTIITTGNLGDVRNLSARTVDVSSRKSFEMLVSDAMHVQRCRM